MKTDSLTAAADVPGDVLRDEIIAPREYTSFTMRRTNVLRIIDLEGQQVPDVIAFNLDDLEESLSNGFTTHVLGTYNPTEGHVLYSDDVRPMFTIAKDTVGATTHPRWSAATNLTLYGTESQGRGIAAITWQWPSGLGDSHGETSLGPLLRS
jgi:uncharacterized protein YcgI (DUF1989 family)